MRIHLVSPTSLLSRITKKETHNHKHGDGNTKPMQILTRSDIPLIQPPRPLWGDALKWADSQVRADYALKLSELDTTKQFYAYVSGVIVPRNMRDRDQSLFYLASNPVVTPMNMFPVRLPEWWASCQCGARRAVAYCNRVP